ncbi:helicase [Planoprotostelium fungivorum]|uniref:DNA helicase n=1 Tax=Planoprotostelium fungivorum TaxID=1890364 RepID=A0A2P6N1W6_9EUKA|nr:helicase [Planoprotostelium fungivorum]
MSTTGTPRKKRKTSAQDGKSSQPTPKPKKKSTQRPRPPKTIIVIDEDISIIGEDDPFMPPTQSATRAPRKKIHNQQEEDVYNEIEDAWIASQLLKSQKQEKKEEIVPSPKSQAVVIEIEEWSSDEHNPCTEENPTTIIITKDAPDASARVRATQLVSPSCSPLPPNPIHLQPAKTIESPSPETSITASTRQISTENFGELSQKDQPSPTPSQDCLVVEEEKKIFDWRAEFLKKSREPEPVRQREKKLVTRSKECEYDYVANIIENARKHPNYIAYINSLPKAQGTQIESSLVPVPGTMEDAEISREIRVEVEAASPTVTQTTSPLDISPNSLEEMFKYIDVETSVAVVTPTKSPPKVQPPSTTGQTPNKIREETSSQRSTPIKSNPEKDQMDDLLDMLATPESSMVADGAKYRRMILRQVIDLKAEHVKTLRATREGSDREYTIELHEDWYNCDVREGDTINVIADIATGVSASEKWVKFRRGTVLTDQIVLEQNVKSVKYTPPIFHGILAHNVFESAMRNNNWDTEVLRKTMDEDMDKHGDTVYAIREKRADTRLIMRGYIDTISEFGRNYVGKIPKSGSTVRFGNGGKSSAFCITKTISTEESIHSAMYGITGKIDVVVELKQDVKTAGGSEDQNRYVTHVIPLELKTGRPHISHIQQALIYSALMWERYDIEPNYAIVLNIKNDISIQIGQFNRDIFRAVILRRNEIVSHNYREGDNRMKLPPVRRDTNFCQYCDAKIACAIYKKVEEMDDKEAVTNYWSPFNNHLSGRELEYFLQWDRFLCEEQLINAEDKSEMWRISGKEREALGSAMKLVEGKNSPAGQFCYTFERGAGDLNRSLLSLSIQIGDFVKMSTESGHFGLGQGFIGSITEKQVTVETEEPLQMPPSQTVQSPFKSSFEGIMDVEDLGGLRSTSPHISSSVSPIHRQILWRIDQEKLSSNFKTGRDNLIKLLQKEGGDEKRRRLILNGNVHKPKFSFGGKTWTSSQSQPSPISVPRCVFIEFSSRSHGVSGGEGRVDHLNSDQLAAVDKVIAARDYALISGTPGAGKTVTTAWIIHRLLDMNKRILVTGHTNTCVDNLLIKLKDMNVDFLRLGKRSRIHSSLHTFTTEEHKTNMKRQNLTLDLEAFFESKRVVATTCAGVKDIFFSRGPKFDYCFVDEASQVDQPTCLGPLRFADIFVLIGDDRQLQPVTRCKNPPPNITLFGHLKSLHPFSVSHLLTQYRMNREIMSISNVLTYNGSLKCGDERVARQRLKINLDLLETTRIIDDEHWLHTALDPERPVVMLSTDEMVETNEKRSNPIEAIIVHTCGMRERDIGVISPYKDHLKLIRSTLQKMHPEVEIETVDKYQGRDKECIIFSTVHNNNEGEVGLLSDQRRVNVAVTRAKSKLIIIGSPKTLQTDATWQIVMELMEENKWIYKLPKEAHTTYGGTTSNTKKKPTARRLFLD